ncbi:hypothetical protein BH10PSE3_BH10PSE3_01890 [soil metagenome]
MTESGRIPGFAAGGKIIASASEPNARFGVEAETELCNEPDAPPSHVAIIAAALFTLAACDKDSGHAQKTTGKIESGVGSITGDKELKREGKKDEVVGGVKSAASDLKGAVKDAKD